MLIDGKEVFTQDYKKSSKLQDKLNHSEFMGDDIKTELKANDILKSFEDHGSMNQSDLNIFFGDQKFGEDEDLTTRLEGYDIYDDMDGMEFIHRGLEVISDDASLPNEEGNTIEVYSDSEEQKGVLKNLFIEKLDMNNELWSIIYETIKKGDNYYEIIVDDYDKPKEIKRIRYLNPKKVERIETNGKLSHFTYKTNNPEQKDKSKKEEVLYKLFPWQIVHFKIEDKTSHPYGGSLLKSGVRTYKRLTMLEDIMLVYRISRAPERRVFYIDVGNLNAVEAKRFLNRMKEAYKSQPFLDEKGNINKRANVMSITSDIFVPVREGGATTRIEALQGGTAMGASGEDPLLEYFKNKILKTMNIPPQYLGEQSDKSRNLSIMDAYFGRFIERIQAQIIKGLNKIAALELFFKGYKKEDLQNFTIELSPPSNVKEITEIDIINQRMQLIGTIMQLDVFPIEWILKKVLRMSDKEIADIKLARLMQAQQAQAGGGGADMDMGGADMDMGGADMDMGGADMDMSGEAPPEDMSGEAPPEEAPPEELEASTIVKLFGKDILLENKEDFFRLLKTAKKYEIEQSNKKELPLIESIAEYLTADMSPKRKKSKNSLYSQMSLNELGGLNFKDRMVSLFEKDGEDEREIECGNKEYLKD